MPESIAENEFQKFTGADAATLLLNLPRARPRTVETTWLDFKSGYVKPEDFPRIWSEVIGAFANTAGGVVIWGIGARPDKKTGIDAAKSVEFVDDVDMFTTRLKTAARSSTDPPVQIDYRQIVSPGHDPKGFVVCHIPEGLHKPYESLNAEGRFFMRFDDSCKKVPLPALRLLFNPSLATRIRPLVQITALQPMAYRLDFTLENKGPNSIEALCIRLENSNETAMRTARNDWPLPGFINLEPSLLHPGMASTYGVLLKPLQLSIGREKFILRVFQRSHPAQLARFEVDYAGGDFFGGERVLDNPLELKLEEESLRL